MSEFVLDAARQSTLLYRNEYSEITKNEWMRFKLSCINIFKQLHSLSSLIKIIIRNMTSTIILCGSACENECSCISSSACITTSTGVTSSTGITGITSS